MRLGESIVRAALALCQLIGHCAAGRAAWRSHRLSAELPHRNDARVRFAVPGWTSEQTRSWLDNASTDPDSD